MKLFIDGEWNSYQGELISLALVAEDGSEWYEVLGCALPDSWVSENVIPKLGKSSVSYEKMQESLSKFLNTFDSIHIIADWPEDLGWLCHVLITGPGQRLDTPPMTMEVIRVDTVSMNPHNALADATALKDWYITHVEVGVENPKGGVMEIKTWKERAGLYNDEPFRRFIGVEWLMQDEINELRAALVERVPLTRYGIESALTKAIKDRKLSWLGFKKDSGGVFSVPVLSECHYQIAAAIEDRPSVMMGVD
jgi:hypothetical protein